MFEGLVEIMVHLIFSSERKVMVCFSVVMSYNALMYGICNHNTNTSAWAHSVCCYLERIHHGTIPIRSHGYEWISGWDYRMFVLHWFVYPEVYGAQNLLPTVQFWIWWLLLLALLLCRFFFTTFTCRISVSFTFCGLEFLTMNANWFTDDSTCRVWIPSKNLLQLPAQPFKRDV